MKSKSKEKVKKGLGAPTKSTLKKKTAGHNAISYNSKVSF